MKKFRILFGLAAIIAATVIFHSCQKETMQPEMKVANVLKNGDVIKTYDFYQGTNYRGTMTYDDVICVGEPTALVFTGFAEGKNIKVDYYDIDLGDWVEVENNAQTAPYTAYVTALEVGTFTYRARIWNSGFETFTVTAIECCVPGFTYVDNLDGTYTFTLVPEEDIDDAFLEFTFAQGELISGLPEWTQPGNGQVRQYTMDLIECETYVWVVELEATNFTGNPPCANVWTDFKVNAVSMKNDPEDKFIQCQ